MLTDRWTDARTAEKVIMIGYPEHSSGELKIRKLIVFKDFKTFVNGCCHFEYLIRLLIF